MHAFEVVEIRIKINLKALHCNAFKFIFFPQDAEWQQR